MKERSICKAAICLVALAAQTFEQAVAAADEQNIDETVDNIADKFSERVYQKSPSYHEHLENTALGKSSNIGHTAMSSSHFSTLAASRPRLGASAVVASVVGSSHSRRPPFRPAAGPPVQEDSPAEGGLFGAIKNLQRQSPVKEGKTDEGGLFGAFQNFQTSLPKQLQLEEGWYDKLSKTVEEEMFEFVIGRKEKRWSPDRRPKDQQGKSAGPSETSLLKWGGANSKEMYKEMVEMQHKMTIEEGRAKMKDQPLGSAAVSVFGEVCKVDEAEDLQEGLAEACKLAQVPEGEARTISGGVELAEMIHGKYGHYHDVAVLRNVGQVGFNIYGPWLGQRNFPYTEEQYLQKLDGVSSLLNDLDQAWYLKNFLLSPVRPRNGLPSRPRSDTAVTVRLNLSPTWKEDNQEIFDAWIMLKGQR